MKIKILVDNVKEAEFLNHLIHTGLLNMNKDQVEEFFPEFIDDKLGITFMLKNKSDYVYGAREIESGKLVSDITNPKRKYWDKKGNAQSAIDCYNKGYANRKLPHSANKGEHGFLELVTFELVEVKDE